ncbi:MAG: hypothetical protein IPN53_08615 [Comamonadaceae bacterium]|nr:hypothetical protein [Comamonadaceae bacterium]
MHHVPGEVCHLHRLQGIHRKAAQAFAPMAPGIQIPVVTKKVAIEWWLLDANGELIEAFWEES